MFTDRPVSVDDLPLLVAIAAASEPVDRLHVLFSERDIRHYLVDPDVDPQRDMRLWLLPDGTPAASAMMSIHKRSDRVSSWLTLRVLPELRADLESSVLEWAVARLNDVDAPHDLPRELTVSVNSRDTDRCNRLLARGHEPVREYGLLDCPLDGLPAVGELPHGFLLRTVAVDADLERWHDLFNQSFIDHWNFHPMPLDDLRHEWGLPDYDPTLDFVIAAEDGSLDAFCSAEIDEADNGIGWISLVGTRRGRRGRGLGRAVVVSAMTALAQRGAHTARLLVDRESPTNAGALYERLGFGETAVTVRMRLTLPTGPQSDTYLDVTPAASAG